MLKLLTIIMILWTNFVVAHPINFFDFVKKSSKSTMFSVLYKGYVEHKEQITLADDTHMLRLVFIEKELEGGLEKSFYLVLDGSLQHEGCYSADKINASDLQLNAQIEQNQAIIEEKLEIKLRNDTYELVKELNNNTGEFWLKWRTKNLQFSKTLLSGKIYQQEIAMVPPLEATTENNTPIPSQPNPPQSAENYVIGDRIMPLNGGIVMDSHSNKSGMIMHIGNSQKSMDDTPIGAMIATNRYGRGNSYGVFASGAFQEKNVTALFKTNNGIFALFGDTLVALNHTVRHDFFPEHTKDGICLEARLRAVGYSPEKVIITDEINQFCSQINVINKTHWGHLLWLVMKASN